MIHWVRLYKLLQNGEKKKKKPINRFYIMHIENRPLKFSTITHHASVTQCLGSVGGNVWYLGVVKPSIVDDYEVKDDTGGNNEIVQSRCGHFYVPPAVESLCFQS